MNKERRIGYLIRNIPRFSLQRLASFSSHWAANPRSPYASIDEEDEVEENGSKVYRHVLRHQRPTTIRWQPWLDNSVSFIGRVVRPIEIYKTKRDIFGAFTYITVRDPRDLNLMFRIQVETWDDLAKMGVQHLKKDDIICVSGHLGYYERADDNGNLRLFYKIIVKELNYVAPNDQGPTFQNPEESQSNPCKKWEGSQSNASEISEEPESVGAVDETNIERHADHIYLWQLFFCKPHEWWDKRKNKQNSGSPDFKHKFTGESLWLRPDDPPWVKRQLQWLDMQISRERQQQDVGVETYMSHLHLWQVFFSNPHEWWDNRKNKKHPRLPDFKHKDTGEALWMHPDDPPWVKRQLQLLDSKVAEEFQGENIGSHSGVSKLKFDC